MVFLDYTTHTFTGNNQTFTVPYKAMITCEMNSFTYTGGTGNNPAGIALNGSNNNTLIKTIFSVETVVSRASFSGVINPTFTTNLHSIESHFAPIYDSGQVIRVVGFQTINAVMHIFRLPEAP